MTARAYLDWNASAPLAPAARAAMLDAIEQVGNPSSQHSEGRAARRIVETARERVAALVGAERDEIVFTSGATEAIAAALLGRAEARRPWAAVELSRAEHAAVVASAEAAGADGARLFWRRLTRDGGLGGIDAVADDGAFEDVDGPKLRCRSAANSETGVVDLEALDDADAASTLFVDATQAAARPARRSGDGALIRFDATESTAAYAALSAHKLGGPRGVGALYVARSAPAPILVPGGGQELRRRSGTENVVGAAGFGAAAEALTSAPPDWSAVEEMRDAVESAVSDAAEDAAFFRPTLGAADGLARLVNTSMFAIPGWPAEIQLMQLDLGGVSVSAGSACSSGRLSASPTLRAMGVDAELAGCAIRVSIGPTTTPDDIQRFISVWRGALSARRR